MESFVQGSSSRAPSNFVFVKACLVFQELMMDTIVKVMDLDLLRRLKETG
jgi:hypothetical protein